MMPTIRPYQPGDELGMAYAHSRSILELCSKDYPAESIVKWAVKYPEKYATKAGKGERFWVVDANGIVAGLGSWKNDEIGVCYMHPEYVGQGLARRLMEAVEADYRAKTGNAYLKLESTITAQPFYEAMGFTTIEAAKHTFPDGKTVLDIWKMIKHYQ